MKKYMISTDTTCDLPADYLTQHHIGLLALSYTIDNQNYDYDNALPEREFYDKMRNGHLPTTAQVNPETAGSVFEALIQENDAHIIHISFSSGLSGTYSSVSIAADTLAEKYPQHRIVVIDSLCASLGEGLLVHMAIQNKEQGMSFEDNIQWLEQHKLNIVHNFTVDDLFHLHRGGRVSKTAAVFGTMINIKPVLHVDNEGHLIPVAKVRGRKKSLAALVDSMEQQIGSYRSKNAVIFISHGDCLEDAEYVKELIQKRFSFDQFLINYVGPVIGAHAGAGTVALFYMGDIR